MLEVYNHFKPLKDYQAEGISPATLAARTINVKNHLEEISLEDAYNLTEEEKKEFVYLPHLMFNKKSRGGKDHCWKIAVDLCEQFNIKGSAVILGAARVPHFIHVFKNHLNGTVENCEMNKLIYGRLTTQKNYVDKSLIVSGVQKGQAIQSFLFNKKIEEHIEDNPHSYHIADFDLMAVLDDLKAKVWLNVIDKAAVKGQPSLMMLSSQRDGRTTVEHTTKYYDTILRPYMLNYLTVAKKREILEHVSLTYWDPPASGLGCSRTRVEMFVLK